jgi:hypothetical protein
MLSPGYAEGSRPTEISLSDISFSRLFAVMDRQDDARNAAKAGLMLDPSFTIRRFRASAASDNPTYLARRERIYEGMRQAGVPEG